MKNEMKRNDTLMEDSLEAYKLQMFNENLSL